MKANKQTPFHKLYSKGKPRVVYYKRDFGDYFLMIVMTGLLIVVSYGLRNVLSLLGVVLCCVMVTTFAVRHGIDLALPALARRPQGIIYALTYKVQNLKPTYFIALGVLLLENLLIAATPSLPHHVGLMRRLALDLFYIHIISVTVFRTAILVDHLAKKQLVREVLMQTPWRRVVKQKTNISVEIIHAYSTGLLTHIITLAPWYLVIKYSRFSLVFLPITALISIAIHLKWAKVFNAWFYRDHWLGHNAEFDFLFLHGPHHDAIPSGMIAVAENGFLEGFIRFTLGAPIALYSPLISFLLFMIEIPVDIRGHQYIPGVFPRLPRTFMERFQHSTHHYGPLEPYSIASKSDGTNTSKDFNRTVECWIPEEVKNSIELDEKLTGFKWDNPTYRTILRLWDKYQV
jgi:hypothetical protein